MKHGEFTGNKQAYFQRLIGRIYKLLILREENNPTLGTYIESLVNELMYGTITTFAMHDDADFMSLIMTLESLRTLSEKIYGLAENDPEHQRLCALYRREVLKCTNLCSQKYIK